MKKIVIYIATVLAAATFSGCASSASTILEFDANGNVTKKTETSQSILETLVSSTKDKSVVLWEDSLTAYISVSGGTIDDPTPHGKIFAGKVNRGVITLHTDQKCVAHIAEAIQATKSDVAVNLDGVQSSSSERQPTATDK